MTRNRMSAKKASEAAAAKLLAIPVEDRLRDSSRVTDAGCWEWTRYRYSNGYAALSVNGKQRLALGIGDEAVIVPMDMTNTPLLVSAMLADDGETLQIVARATMSKRNAAAVLRQIAESWEREADENGEPPRG